MIRRMKSVDQDTQAGVSAAFRTIYEPERAAIEQFDDLIHQLGKDGPPSSTAPPASRRRA